MVTVSEYWNSTNDVLNEDVLVNKKYALSELWFFFPLFSDHPWTKILGFIYHRKQWVLLCFPSLVWFDPLQRFFGNEGHVALDINPGTGYDTLLLRMIPGDLLSACPHRQFHTLPGLLDSWAALPNSNPNACMPCREAVCTIFMMVFGMTRPRGELTTYRARGGHATDWANPTRCVSQDLTG